jgi:hypothetical protein
MPIRVSALPQTIARRHLFSGALFFSLSLIVNTAIALHNGIPQPRIQDEFSYLLAADTFAHGRLTNPTPPFPEHFETPHVLVRPTYMSKYPPGQGIVLAVGQAFTAQPIIGVWLSSAAAAAAIYWMLLGFLPAPWALLGGLAAAIHPQMLAWSQTYWGGSVAVFGAALLIGAWTRLMSQTSISHAILLAIGLIILANSRPYEGLILCLPLTLTLLMRAVRQPLPLFSGGAEHRGFLPLLAILTLAALWMGHYNARITGHALRMPFMEYSAQYDIYPKFWFLPQHPSPTYTSDAVARIHTDFEPGDYDLLQTPRGVLNISARRLWQFLSMHTRPWLLLLLPFAAAASLWRDPKIKWIWITLAIFFLGLCAENWFLPNYAAPATPILLLLIVAGWKQLWNWGRTARFIAAASICAWLIAATISAVAPPPPDSLRFGRADLIATYPQLRTGRHLIFVQYESGHLLHDEWVFNSADLEHANIIWARALGRSADAPVIRYFHDRQPWLLRIGETQLQFDRYP